jgi:hypothetical protein
MLVSNDMLIHTHTHTHTHYNLYHMGYVINLTYLVLNSIFIDYVYTQILYIMFR